MRQLTPSSGLGLPHEYLDTAESDHSEPVPLRSMAETVMPTHNADVRWEDFPSQDYWHHNYKKVLPVDQEIIRFVGSFFIGIFRGRPRVQRAIDVGSGGNLYPALLMLPWAEQILLTDYSESSVNWLHDQVMDDDGPWTWQPFWRELGARDGYDQVSDPRRQLRKACADSGGSRESSSSASSTCLRGSGNWAPCSSSPSPSPGTLGSSPRRSGASSEHLSRAHRSRPLS